MRSQISNSQNPLVDCENKSLLHKANLFADITDLQNQINKVSYVEFAM